MRLLGFRYNTRKKTFDVHGHERPDVVVHRSWYTTEYLSALERRCCLRWIQLPKEDADKMKAGNNIDPTDVRGYHYTVDNVEMVKYPVDDYEFLFDVAKDYGYVFGRTFSV